MLRRDARRQIERWQGKSFAVALFEANGVSNGYQLEGLLMQDGKEGKFPSDQPRIFGRMASSGEPAILRQLSKPNSKVTRWVTKALARNPGPLSVLEEVIWRLLDPDPIGHQEWHCLGVKFALAGMPLTSKPVALTVSLPVEVGGSDHDFRSGESTNRRGITGVLLQMRRCESHGDLVGYYLNLLESLECCQTLEAGRELAVLLPELANFLTLSFGRVYVGPDHIRNIEYQQLRLAVARQLFEKARQNPLRFSSKVVIVHPRFDSAVTHMSGAGNRPMPLAQL